LQEAHDHMYRSELYISNLHVWQVEGCHATS